MKYDFRTTYEACEEIIKRYNPELKNLDEKKYKKLTKQIKNGDENAYEELNNLTVFMIYDYIAHTYVEHGKPLQTFEDALAEAYIVTTNVVSCLREFPKDCKTYNKDIKKCVRHKFKKMDKDTKATNIDLNYDEDSIIRNNYSLLKNRKYIGEKNEKLLAE